MGLLGRLRRRHRPVDIGAECEAFLSGAFAHHLDDRGDDVPAWAWVNLLAHGTPEQLAELAAGDRLWQGRRARRRAAGIARVAAGMLAHADGDPERLARLQLEVLVPFELGLARPARTVVGRYDIVRRPPSSTGSSQPYVDPPPAVGRNLGNGRINRVALALLGPASVGTQK